MADLFYIIGVIFFFHELMIAHDARAYLDKIRISEKVNAQEGKKGKREYLETMDMDDKKTFMKTAVFGLFYLSWLVIGILFAGQWILFSGILVFGLLIGFYRRRFYKDNTRRSLSVLKTDAVVSLLALAFAIINHFHQIF